MPLEVIGKMVLNRNVDNFFAETEQAAFSRPRRARHRLHQRPAAAGPAVLVPRHAAASPRRPELPRDRDQPAAVPDAQLPARRPHAPEGVRPGASPTSRTASIPTARARVPSAASRSSRTRSRARSCACAPRASPTTTARRALFFRSMTEPEQRHIVNAFAFELGKVETMAIRTRMLGHLDHRRALGAAVEEALGMDGRPNGSRRRARRSISTVAGAEPVGKAQPTLAGRKIGVLVTDGVDDGLLDALRSAVEKEGARSRSSRRRSAA